MNREEELMQSDFEKAFAWRHGHPRLITENQNDTGYEAAKWAWDHQEQTIRQLRQQQNDIRIALHRIGVG